MAWPEPVLTGSDGRFALHGIPGNTEVQLEVNDDRFARQSWTLQVPDSAKPAENTINVSPPRVVEGALFYEGTGGAVSGASIALQEALSVASTTFPDGPDLVGMIPAKTNRKRRAESLAAELELAQSEYEKAKTDIEKERLVESERLKSAQSTVQIAEAELRLAQNDLAGTEIRAPISSTILRREAKVGMAFNPNLPGEHSAPLFEVADLRDLVVEADVPHHFFSALSMGQPCNVFEQKSQFYAGKIKSIELHPGTSTHSLRVRVVLDELPTSMGWGVLSSVTVQFLSQDPSVPAK